MKYACILETIGATPIVKLSRLAPAHVSLYAKVESFNPMGSIKDRFARAVIERAEASGALKPGQTVIEATSGNTGGLAMVCAQKGYPLVIVMAENFSIERRRLMRHLGAKVVLTPAAQKGSGMLAKAIELAETHGWFLARQFENEANADIHSETTAQEIIADFEGERLDYWVSTFGTGGTVKGVARALRAARPDTRIVVAEPDNSPMLEIPTAVVPAEWPKNGLLEPRVDRLALQGEHGEDAFVHAPQWGTLDEAMQRLKAYNENSPGLRPDPAEIGRSRSVGLEEVRERKSIARFPSFGEVLPYSCEWVGGQ